MPMRQVGVSGDSLMIDRHGKLFDYHRGLLRALKVVKEEIGMRG